MSFCFVLQFQKIHLSLIVHLHTKNQNGPSITAYQTILQFQLKVFRKKHFNSFWYMWSILTLHSKQFLLYSMISIIPRKTLITISFFLVCLPLSRGSKWFIDSFWKYCWSRNTESWLPRCILSYNYGTRVSWNIGLEMNFKFRCFIISSKFWLTW